MALNRDAVRTIARVVQQAKRRPQGGGVPPRRRQQVFTAGGLLFAYLPSGTIAARTGTLPTVTFGSGTVTLLTLNSGGTGLVTASTTITAYNPWTTAVPSGKILVLGRINSLLCVLGWDC